MTSEIRLAFDNLDARAAAESNVRLADRISLRDYVADVEIGAFQAERGVTQKVSFNVVVEVRAPNGPLKDDVDRILSYDTITGAITHALASERLNLLETLAERIAETILLAPQAEKVFVRVEKLDRGPGALGVEIVRSRSDAALVLANNPDVPQIHPRVIFLSNVAVHSPLLAGWLDQIQALDVATVLTVGATDDATPVTDASEADRRIALLAIEQNAWVLAARDLRLSVVHSRTELDWAAKNGRISVWAPSKMILDSPAGFAVQPTDAREMTSWLCKAVSASEFVSVGLKIAEIDGVPGTQIDPLQVRLFEAG